MQPLACSSTYSITQNRSSAHTIGQMSNYIALPNFFYRSSNWAGICAVLTHAAVTTGEVNCIIGLG